MMKCIQCKKEIIINPILITIDGDFVCDKKCKERFYKEMDIICKMTNKEFEEWCYKEI